MDGARITTLSSLDDAALIAMWLHGRPLATRRAYAAEIGKLVPNVLGARSLSSLTLADLQSHADQLAYLAPRSQARALAAIRSFFEWHTRIGTLKANPAAALRAPKIPSDLAERILTEPEVLALLAGGRSPRERLMLRLLYVAGLRAAELGALRWKHLAQRSDGGQLSVTGKGSKTRQVLIPADLVAELLALRGAAQLAGNAGPGDPIFPAATAPKRGIAPRQLLQVVKRAAKAAGLPETVSCHWMRHCHASHSLDNGAPVTLVQQSLGHASVATTSRYLHARPNDGSARFLRS